MKHLVTGLCKWYLEQGVADQPPPHPTLVNPTDRWCARYVSEYRAMPAAGIIPVCRLRQSDWLEKRGCLIGLEFVKRSGQYECWCYLQGRADTADRNTQMVACREAAEESCYALGSTRQLYANVIAGLAAPGKHSSHEPMTPGSVRHGGRTVV